MSNSSKADDDLKVGIVDDSPLIRQMIQSVIEETPGMCVVGQAGDPYEARAMIKEKNPDVITLDVEMPRMNGIEFLEKIMKLRPMPVIMVSTLTKKGADVTLKALEIGAIDYVPKPDGKAIGTEGEDVFRHVLVPKLRTVKSANFSAYGRFTAQSNQGGKAALRTRLKPSGYDCIGIASSTGGIERLRYLIANINAPLPPILIVQHINNLYVPNLAKRMQSIAPSHVQVKVAKQGEPLEANTVYFADNLQHLQVQKAGTKLCVQLVNAPPVNGFIASADLLFKSMAEAVAGRSMGVVLSGMGHDGAKGLVALHGAGGRTIGESEASCLVYGMSKAAFEAGAIDKEMSLEDISGALNML